jgi:hypothetical protein
MDRKHSYVYGSAAPNIAQRAEQPLEQQRIERKQTTPPVPKKIKHTKSQISICFTFCRQCMLRYPI